MIVDVEFVSVSYFTDQRVMVFVVPFEGENKVLNRLLIKKYKY
jgi:hypothetical protein